MLVVLAAQLSARKSLEVFKLWRGLLLCRVLRRCCLSLSTETPDELHALAVDVICHLEPAWQPLDVAPEPKQRR